MLDSFELLMENILNDWRDRRDDLLKKYNFDKDTIYAEGRFDKLPPDLLIAICYVDAYASDLATYRELRTE